MTEFRVMPEAQLLIPDDLTVPQFLLDSTHPNRAIRPSGTPWLIQEETGRQIHLEELRSRVAGVANTLTLDYGLKDNEVACVFTPNHIDFPVVVWALHRLGLTASCANPSYTTPELVHCLQASKSRFIFVHPPSLPIALEAAKQVGIPVKNVILFNVPGVSSPKGFVTVDDLVVNGLARPQGYVEVRLAPGEGKTKVAFLSFSSGTTGKPKAIAISHYSPIANVIQTCVHVGVESKPKQGSAFTPGDVALGVLPFFHIYGLIVGIHFVLFAGQSLVVSPKFSFITFCESIKKYKVSVLFLVPPHIVLICKHPASKKYDWSQIKVLMSGAAPLTHAINEQVVKMLPNAAIGQGYGMTETATSICWPPLGVKHAPFGSAGRLMPGVTVRIVKEDGSLGKAGERGEILIRSISNAIGYVDAPEANAETFVDGWVRTGDEGSVDQDNWVYVHDRLKELIKVRGFQVAPAELEGHILSHADVRDTCVVSVLDDYSGELPLAFIALSEDAAKRVEGHPAEVAKVKASVAKHVADHMINYKHLHGGVEIIDEIPKNPSGKLLRRVLREKARAMPKSKPAKAKL